MLRKDSAIKSTELYLSRVTLVVLSEIISNKGIPQTVHHPIDNQTTS